MRIEDIYDSAPLIFLVIDEEKRIVHCSKTAAGVFGAHEKSTIDEIVDVETAAVLDDLMVTLRRDEVSSGHLLSFFRRDGGRMVVAGLVDKMVGRNGSTLMRLTALLDPDPRRWLDDLVESEELLRGFVQTSTEAMFCIDFTEPVDLTQGDHEIVRQVFENERLWRLCNESMARMYDLPEGLDFNMQPVSLYFPRNPGNEAFVRQIIESNFTVDKALSIDTRHDGSTMYVENTVRSHIEGGRMLRMWGTVRDVTDYRQAHNRLALEVQDVRGILSAVPDAILVIDRNRKLLAVNPSFEALFGWASTQFLGRDIQSIIDLESPLAGGRRWYGFDRQRWVAEVKMQAGVSMLCDVQSAPIGDEAPDRFVLSLRPALMETTRMETDESTEGPARE